MRMHIFHPLPFMQIAGNQAACGADFPVKARNDVKLWDMPSVMFVSCINMRDYTISSSLCFQESSL